MAFAKGMNGPWLLKNKLKFRSRKHQTYILPTLFGLGFATLAVVFLLLSFGLSNNFAVLFVLALTSLGISGMRMTNQNIRRLSPQLLESEILFADEPNDIPILVKNDSKSNSHIVTLNGKQLSESTVNVSAGEEKICVLQWTPTQRGWQKSPRLRLSSEYPFGLLRAWQTVSAERPVLVYPARKGLPDFPLDSSHVLQTAEAGVFKELRELQNYDSPSRIHWPQSLRHQELLVKTYEQQNSQPQLYFRWEMTGQQSSAEARLSQMSLWVDMAETKGFQYGMSLGKIQIEVGSGRDHYHRCLKFLATVDLSKVDLSTVNLSTATTEAAEELKA